MLKLTQPHLSMNNMFPPINAHTRSPSEDLPGVNGGGIAEINSASKQQNIRRQQQTIDQQRRSPLRNHSLLTTSPNRFVTTAAAVAVPISSALVRSSSFVQNGASVPFEPAKIIYRSNDYAWNDHPNNINVPNQPLRAASPIKTKLSTSTHHLINGMLHDNTANSMLHLPTSSSSPNSPQQQHIKDLTNNGDLHLTSATKPRRTARLQRTNSHLDKTPRANSNGLPIRSESYRSSRLDYSLRPCYTSPKQRSYVISKTSIHDITQDENTYHQQQQQMNTMSSTQRLNVSTFDLATSRKTLSPNKSNSFNVSTNGTNHHGNYHSVQELHHSETNIDRNNLTRFIARDTTSKEQLITISKYRQTSSKPTTSNTAVINQSGERHPSAKSYESRDPNISYAYTDVKKYIEENDLMSPEKEQFIQNWIIDVEKNRHQFQKLE